MSKNSIIVVVCLDRGAFFLGASNDQKAMAGRGVGRVERGRLGEGNREGEIGRGAMGREGKEVGRGRQGWG